MGVAVRVGVGQKKAKDGARAQCQCVSGINSVWLNTHRAVCSDSVRCTRARERMCSVCTCVGLSYVCVCVWMYVCVMYVCVVYCLHSPS